MSEISPLWIDGPTAMRMAGESERELVIKLNERDAIIAELTRERDEARASRNAASRGWAFDSAAKIADELFRLGDEPNSPTHRIEFKGGRYTTDKSQERGQGGLNQIAFARWLACALARHVPNKEITGKSP